MESVCHPAELVFSALPPPTPGVAKCGQSTSCLKVELVKGQKAEGEGPGTEGLRARPLRAGPHATKLLVLDPAHAHRQWPAALSTTSSGPTHARRTSGHALHPPDIHVRVPGTSAGRAARSPSSQPTRPESCHQPDPEFGASSEGWLLLLLRWDVVLVFFFLLCDLQRGDYGACVSLSCISYLIRTLGVGHQPSRLE